MKSLLSRVETKGFLRGLGLGGGLTFLVLQSAGSEGGGVAMFTLWHLTLKNFLHPTGATR